ncbi:hypothetical protein DES45_10691 [Microvirga subterranea]|uniref:Uncharacterized protein n=1 Tax=Microvirga subterranea TaxID=186651 RepID=A0A370HMM9_9HYPH|nr:hypothetical protein DES45_10691 [Microvirga subterranea]
MRGNGSLDPIEHIFDPPCIFSEISMATACLVAELQNNLAGQLSPYIVVSVHIHIHSYG